jgi:hypothetical protein
MVKALTNLQTLIKDYIDENCDVVYLFEAGVSKDFIETAFHNGVKLYHYCSDGYIYEVDEFVLEELEKEGFFGNDVCYYNDCYYLSLDNLYDIIDLIKEAGADNLEAVFSDLSLTITDLILFVNGYDYYLIDVSNLYYFIKDRLD